MKTMQTPQPKYEILLADDDRTIRRELKAVLECAGYDVRTAADGVQALELYAERRPDLLLLDVMMPKKNGRDLCRDIRAADATTPVVFLTALDSEPDELEGLEAGADVYIPKTVSPDILLARIAAAIRRNRRENPDGDFAFAGWRVTPRGCSMHGAGGREAALSEREIALLRLFAAHPGEIISRDYIGSKLWADDTSHCENALNVLVSRLREKLGDDACAIESVRGSGYVFRGKPLTARCAARDRAGRATSRRDG